MLPIKYLTETERLTNPDLHIVLHVGGYKYIIQIWMHIWLVYIQIPIISACNGERARITSSMWSIHTCFHGGWYIRKGWQWLKNIKRKNLPNTYVGEQNMLSPTHQYWYQSEIVCHACPIHLDLELLAFESIKCRKKRNQLKSLSNTCPLIPNDFSCPVGVFFYIYTALSD